MNGLFYERKTTSQGKLVEAMDKYFKFLYLKWKSLSMVCTLSLIAGIRKLKTTGRSENYEA